MSFCLNIVRLALFLFFFFFNDTATTEIYTLSLHDALPILPMIQKDLQLALEQGRAVGVPLPTTALVQEWLTMRSEEHTSELQSLAYLVCRLLLEKKKKITTLLTRSFVSSALGTSYLE